MPGLDTVLVQLLVPIGTYWERLDNWDWIDESRHGVYGLGKAYSYRLARLQKQA